MNGLLPVHVRLPALAACAVLVLGTTSGCGSDPSAQPSADATVTVTASVPATPTGGPSTASEPGPSQEPHTPTTPAQSPSPRAKPAPVDLSDYDLPGFSTPSGNIGCLFDNYQGPHVRCDRLKMQGLPSRKPADCDFDWGHSVELSAGDRGALACTSDTVMGMQGETDGTRMLPYGDSVRYRGITCTSTESGLGCETSGGHGFVISRASIRVR